MGELDLDRISYARGNRGKKVGAIQEWLCLNGYGIVVDGDFGPATEFAARLFRERVGLPSNGRVDRKTFASLTNPMRRALEEIAPGRKTLRQMVVAVARQHLGQHPREIGGDNRGPWVRLYMKGNDGLSWKWCAGFCSFVLEQSCRILGESLPIRTSFSCDSLVASAKENDLFVSGRRVQQGERITPGSLFVQRRTFTDWSHVGIVTRADEEVFDTIEGNTNDEGNGDGYEVCKRIRGYSQKDFILL